MPKVNWTRNDQAKIPYSPWKNWNLSRFTAKLLKALGMRKDEDGVNTTHRQDFNDPNGNPYPDEKNLCHHFEQEGATADAIKISIVGGSAIRVHVPNGYTGNVFEIYEANAQGGYPTTPTRSMNDQGVWS